MSVENWLGWALTIVSLAVWAWAIVTFLRVPTVAFTSDLERYLALGGPSSST